MSITIPCKSASCRFAESMFSYSFRGMKELYVYPKGRKNLFLKIFRPICGKELVLPVMVVSRGISYYTQLIISAVMTGAAYFIITDKNVTEAK